LKLGIWIRGERIALNVGLALRLAFFEISLALTPDEDAGTLSQT